MIIWLFTFEQQMKILVRTLINNLTRITSVQLKVVESQLLRSHQMFISRGVIHKQLIERNFLEDVDAQNLQYSAQTFVDSMNLIETGHHEVNAYSDPDLGAHGVLRGAEEGLDAQVLLNPLEEEFDLPPAFVNGCDGNSGQFEVVGKKDQSLACMGIDITDTPECFGIISFPFPCAQSDCLVASQSGGFVDRSRLADVELCVAFCANDKGCLYQINAVEACEVEVASVDHVDAPRFKNDLVEEMNIVNGAIGNTDKYRNRAGQVDLGMQFDRSLNLAEVCPRKHRQAQVDSRGVDSIDHLVEIESVGVISIESASFADENLPEGFINTPVAMLVGIGQIGSSNVTTYAHCVALRAVAQTRFDIPQALAESDLRESHRKELVTRSHSFAAPRHRIQLHATIELFAVNEIGYLSEDKVSGVHPLLRMKSPKVYQPVQMRHTAFEPLAA